MTHTTASDLILNSIGKYMFLCVRKIKRICHELSSFKKISIFGVTVGLVWVLGILDKVREKSYDEFTWPAEDSLKWTSSKFTQFPRCRFTSNEDKLMIIIKSSAKNGAMRESVRKTWGKYRKEDGVEVMPVFILGRVHNLELMKRIDRESEENRDILAISAIDSYRNNTLKLFSAIDYAANPNDCFSPDFTFLVDDDYMVHIPNLVKFAKKKRKKDLVYEGFVFDTSPFRLKVHKHSISLEEYPFSRYPPYVSAGAVFLTSETVQRFQSSMRKLKIFPFDDVFTGILAKTVSVPAIHNENFIFWSRRVTRNEWNGGVIAVHGCARNDLEYEYSLLFGLQK